MDVKTTFLNGDLEKEVYMKQPKEFVMPGNEHQSKIMGVNVEDGMVKNAASKLGCLVLKTPFTYLGTKVGGNMSRKQAWKEVVDKVEVRTLLDTIVHEVRVLQGRGINVAITPIEARGIGEHAVPGSTIGMKGGSIKRAVPTLFALS
ncbi:hypothetical protein Tco_0746231 [Tanacetum coccineum]